LDQLKQAIADALTPVSEHEDAVAVVKAVAADIRQNCPGLKLECVFLHVQTGGGAYAATSLERSSAELLMALGDAERQQLETFVGLKLETAERITPAA